MTGSLLLVACGGGPDATVSPKPPADTTPPPAPPPPTVTQSTTGTVYLRSDTIAYTADYVPTSGLANAQVSLSTATVATTSTGSFRLTTQIPPQDEFIPLSTLVTGYLPALYPWQPADTLRPVPIGVYPNVTGVPRPGFMKGAGLNDGGGWIPGWLNKGLFSPTIDRLKDYVGADAVLYMEPAWLIGIDLATNSVTMGMQQVNFGFGMLSREQWTAMVTKAHSRDLKVIMLLGIEPLDASVSNGVLYAIPASNTAFWNAYFAAYTTRVLERAAIARDLGVEYLGLGYHLAYLTRLEPSRWQALIAAVRGIGYTGKLTYFSLASGVNNALELDTAPPGFMPLFDAVGVLLHSAVIRRAGETVAPEQTRARMKADLTTLINRVRTWPVPIWLAINTPSVHGGPTDDQYIDGAVTCASCPASLRERDLQQQADVVFAAGEVINASPTGNGRVMGLFTWQYSWSDDFTYGSRHGDAAWEKTANMRGKPAEAVIRAWFQRW
ncbi:MAG TPA: hypothetical protein VM053_06500 [Gemmatimonadaceae bacterium]|nr:hypothetical protein [Gemmatimonadaceae bacterium]